MKINFYTSPNFGIKRLYSAKIKDTSLPETKQDVDVFISELEKNDLPDFENNFCELQRTKLGGQILLNFIETCKDNAEVIGKDKKYLVVENPELPFEKRFKGIVLAEQFKGFTYISKLQSMSEFPMYKNIKGTGSCLTYGVIKSAEQRGDKCVTLDAYDNSPIFYHKIGFVPIIPMGSHFLVHHTNFNKITKKIENNFQINKLADNSINKI